jgi:Tfp pilus assembly protein PilO
MADEGNGRVTLRDVYEIIQRVEDKVDKRFGEFTEAVRTLETRVARLEDKRVTREEIHDLKKTDTALEILLRQKPSDEEIQSLREELSTIKLWQAGLTAIAGLKRWQITVGLGVLSLLSATLGSLLALYWLHHG